MEAGLASKIAATYLHIATYIPDLLREIVAQRAWIGETTLTFDHNSDRGPPQFVPPVGI